MDFIFFITKVGWIFSQQYSFPHNKIINNVGYFYYPSTQVQKDDITQKPFHVLTLSNNPSKRNFVGLVIQLLDKRECRKATCLAIHLEGLISQQLELNVKIFKQRRKKKNNLVAILVKYCTFIKFFLPIFNIGLHYKFQ